MQVGFKFNAFTIEKKFQIIETTQQRWSIFQNFEMLLYKGRHMVPFKAGTPSSFSLFCTEDSHTTLYD